MNRYLKNTPSFNKIISTFTKSRFIGFDHIATRTFNPIDYHNSLLNEGYYKMGDTYNFPKFNALATWYKSNNKIPRVFLSSYLPSIYDKNITDISKIDYFIKNTNLLTYKEYKNIHQENQYLAWTLLFDSHINHLALELHNIEQFTEDLQKNNFILNNPENPIKISADKCLKQVSVIADKISYNFMDGTHKIPYSFVEFVERTRDGFEENNAKDIFDSTK